MNNYYTPSIEEFRIEFEYELRHPVLVDKGWVKVYEDSWTKEIFTRSDFEKGFGWDRLKRYYDRIYRGTYIITRSESELKVLLKQLGAL